MSDLEETVVAALLVRDDCLEYGDEDGADIMELFIAATLSDRDEPPEWQTMFVRDPLAQSAEYFYRDYRFRKADFPLLLDELGFPERVVLENRCVISGSDVLCILLKRLAYPCRWHDVARHFGRSPSVCVRAFYHGIDGVYGSFHHLLDINVARIRNRLPDFAAAIVDKGAPLDRCWGFMDGTARPCCRPMRFQRLCFSGHKRTHCVKYQSIMCPDGIIAHLWGPLAGHRHDSGMLRESGIIPLLADVRDNNNNSYYVYTDPGYPLMDGLIKPYGGAAITPQQAQFNKSMSTVRECVEWGFGKVVSLWAFVDFKKNIKLFLSPIGKWYIVAVLLTNCHTCLYGSETSHFFHLDPPSLHDYLHAL